MASALPVDQSAAGAMSEGKAEEKLPPVYTSSTFFSWSEVFPTAHDFFRTADQRLRTDCGHSARPSKQKPTKITARCEKQVDGCPFRLCAFLDSERGKWHVSARLCVWDHSHPPRNAAAPVDTTEIRFRQPPSTVPPANDPQKAAILFKAGARFWNAPAFFTQARERSLAVHGYTTHKQAESNSTLRAVCSATKQFNCTYKVLAKREGGCWIFDDERSVLAHTHGRQSPGQGPAPVASVAHAQVAVVRPPLDKTPAGIVGVSSKPVKEVPGAPRTNHRFATVDDAYVAFAVANILHLGVSVFRSKGNSLAGTMYCNRRADIACPFRAVLGPDETESYTVVLPESILSHNHGARSQLLEDPNWRPLIRCPLVLAALDGDTGNGSQTTTKRRLSPVEDSQSAKRGRVDAPPHPASKTPAPASARATYPTPPLSVRTPSTIRVPLRGSTHDSAAGVPLEDRVSLVEAFLFGIEPAISPLAPRLVAAGIDSLEALVGLATLSPALRKVLLEDLDREVAAAGQAGLPSAICLVPSFPS